MGVLLRLAKVVFENRTLVIAAQYLAWLFAIIQGHSWASAKMGIRGEVVVDVLAVPSLILFGSLLCAGAAERMLLPADLSEIHYSRRHCVLMAGFPVFVLLALCARASSPPVMIIGMAQAALLFADNVSKRSTRGRESPDVARELARLGPERSRGLRGLLLEIRAARSSSR